jgi:hypothetical protein
LPNSYNQELTVYYLVKIRKRSAVEEAEKLEPEPKERTTTVSELTEGHGLVELGI